MNTNEPIHNRNAETAPRLRYADPILPNVVYPFNYPMQGLFYPINPSVIMAPNHSQPTTINANDHSSNDQSGVMSPNSDISIVSQPPYKIVSWHDIADSYEGNEEKPKCGKLKDNIYFTQRSASSDMYMVFDKKSDYINNFVNYYFSDKNLARDQKLVALMDDKGIVPLSALAKFPKLHQVDTTVEDLIKAFQCNNFVAAVDIGQNNEKGAQRRDRLCATDVNKNGLDKVSIIDANNELGNNQLNSSVSDINMTIQSDSVCPTQNTPVYIYNPAFVPTIFTQQPGIMPTAAPAINGIPQFNPYIMTQFPYPSHHSQNANPVATINPNANHYIHQSPLTLWPVSSTDYNNHALISQMPFNHNNVVHANHNANTARFLSNSAVVNSSYNSVQTTASAATTEPAGGNTRIN